MMSNNSKKGTQQEQQSFTEEEENSQPTNKRSKTESSIFKNGLLAFDLLERQIEIQKAYQEGKPYPHGQIFNLFESQFLTAVKDEIKNQTKVNFKESDLFRVYQSIDLGNLIPGSKQAKDLYHVMQLRDMLYSNEWKTYIEQIVGLPNNTLTNQIDCSCNCHAPGCHLLCHDDVIGTRKISYIIYLTEPNWKENEGGALELYEPQIDIMDRDDHDNENNNNNETITPTSTPIPVSRVWPIFNSMAFFVVEPGNSFHAVQEVIGDRPRLSLQGWYHAQNPPDNIEHATLQQLKTKKQQQEQQKTEDDDENSIQESGEVFTEQDRECLRQYIQSEYLTDESMKEIQQKFESDDCVQLRNFIKPTWVPKMQPQKLNGVVYDESYYISGISSEWKLIGPAHKQRYLQYVPNSKASDDSHVIGSLLHHVQTNVFESDEMKRYLHHITGLRKPTKIQNSEIRRFRPGLDYTVAHYGLLVNESVLDATLCFVYDENDDKDAWESGDVGGFECYIEADDENDDDTSENEKKKGPADEYNEDDDIELLSVSASNNTLSLVYRDPGTMRFIKYVGSSAPSSRYDICMEYNVPQGLDVENQSKEGDKKNDNLR